MAKKWKNYETKVYETVRLLHPKENVEHNIKIKGKLSETPRQIDVSINRHLPNDFLIYECKDLKRLLDTPKIEELYGKLMNVGAKRGAVVSNSRYTSGAMRTAKELGISLYNLIDTKDTNILPRIYASVFLQDTYLKSFSFLFQSSDPEAYKLTQIPPTQIYFDGPPNFSLSGYAVVRNIWNDSNDLIKKPGRYIYHPTRITSDVFVFAKDEKKPIVVDNVKIFYEVAMRNHLSKVKIIEANGLFDANSGSFQAYGNLKTDKITPYEIQKNSKPTELTLEQAKATFSITMQSIMSEIPGKKMNKN